MDRFQLKQQLMSKSLSKLNTLARDMKSRIRTIKARDDTWPVADLFRTIGDNVGELLVAPDEDTQKELVVDSIVEGAYYLLEHDDDDDLRQLLG